MVMCWCKKQIIHEIQYTSKISFKLKNIESKKTYLLMFKAGNANQQKKNATELPTKYHVEINRLFQKKTNKVILVYGTCFILIQIPLVNKWHLYSSSVLLLLVSKRATKDAFLTTIATQQRVGWRSNQDTLSPSSSSPTTNHRFLLISVV